MRTVNLGFCWPEHIKLTPGQVAPTVTFSARRGASGFKGEEVRVVIHNFYGIAKLIRMYFTALRQNVFSVQHILDNRSEHFSTVIEIERYREESDGA